MKILTVKNRPLDSNCYIIIDGEKSLIIDLGVDFSEILPILKEEKTKPLGVLFTHGHFDHVLGARSALLNGVDIYIDQADGFMLLSEKDSLAIYGGVEYLPVSSYKTLNEGVNDIGGFLIEVIKTPGHTKGSVCIKIGENMFTGDTVFLGTVGRIDLPGGCETEMKNSVKRLIGLDFDYNIYPGHGKSTTLFHEIKTNPYFLRYKND